MWCGREGGSVGAGGLRVLGQPATFEDRGHLWLDVANRLHPWVRVIRSEAPLRTLREVVRMGEVERELRS